jgi:hypothetical protein
VFSKIWHNFWDKFTWVIAYALLPITYPIYLWDEHKKTKQNKLERERFERLNRK